VTLEELRQELRDANELAGVLKHMCHFPSSGSDRRHAYHLLPLQLEYVKLLEAKIELRVHGETSPKRKRGLEALLTNWEKELQPKYIEARDDVVRWRSKQETKAKVIWSGTAREFGEWVLTAFHEKKITASSDMNALEQTCQHFSQKDGKPLNARSIKQNLNNKYNYGKIPPLKKPA
jgi:hypothetical protein